MNAGKKILSVFMSAALILSAMPAPVFAAGIQEGVLSNIQGAVEVKKRGSKAWIQAFEGMKLAPGDEISTGIDGTATLTFKGSVSNVDPLTQFAVGRAVEGDAQIFTEVFMAVGKLTTDVDKHASEKNRFNVVTPTAVAGVRGTVQEVTVAGDGTTQCNVEQGEGFFVPNPNPPQVLKVMLGTAEPAKVDEAKQKEFEAKKEKSETLKKTAEDAKAKLAEGKEDRKAASDARKAVAAGQDAAQKTVGAAASAAGAAAQKATGNNAVAAAASAAAVAAAGAMATGGDVKKAIDDATKVAMAGVSARAGAAAPERAAQVAQVQAAIQSVISQAAAQSAGGQMDAGKVAAQAAQAAAQASGMQMTAQQVNAAAAVAAATVNAAANAAPGQDVVAAASQAAVQAAVQSGGAGASAADVAAAVIHAAVDIAGEQAAKDLAVAVTQAAVSGGASEQDIAQVTAVVADVTQEVSGVNVQQEMVATMQAVAPEVMELTYGEVTAPEPVAAEDAMGAFLDAALSTNNLQQFDQAGGVSDVALITYDVTVLAAPVDYAAPAPTVTEADLVAVGSGEVIVLQAPTEGGDVILTTDEQLIQATATTDLTGAGTTDAEAEAIATSGSSTSEVPAAESTSTAEEEAAAAPPAPDPETTPTETPDVPPLPPGS